MDWSKAKSILIICFLILNIFLGFQVWSDEQNQRIQGQLSPFVIDDIMQKLQSLDITIQGEIPGETPEMAYVNVNSNSFKNQNMSGISAPNITWDEVRGIFDVRLNQPVPLSYSTPIDERDETIKTYVHHYNHYQYDRYLSTQELMVFTQSINQFPIFSSRLALDLTPEGWIGYRQSFYEAEGQGISRKIISAYTALAVLMENGILNEGSVVMHIALGYYSEGFNSDQMSLVPVWRVSHSKGNHYINGFTGAILETRQE